MIPVIAILAMLGALIWISTTLLFGGVLAAWAGDRQLVHTCVRSGWETSDIPTLMREIGSLIGQLFLSTVLPGAGVLAFIAAIGFATEGLHDYWIDFKFTRSLGTYNNAANAIITCIVVLWFMLCITFLIGRGIVKSNAFGFKNFVKANAIFWAIPVGVAIYAAVTYAIGQVIEWVVSFTAGAWTGKIAVLVLLLGLIIALIFLLIISIRSARRWMEDLLRRLRHTRIDPQLWCDEIRMSPPHEQARLLVFARPENLGISYDRILRLLIDLQKAVKADPALSIYHAKIAEILELRRQERTG